ncbi:MAG: M23 family metallopeptidase [Actinobacteria bacterium]|nr:MAG: M23 family metallopeptidase [Actinomycetota bacterium]
MRRVVIVVLAAALVVVPPAGAWTWPVKGPVLQKFVLGDDPYAAGQHRGIDIGAPAGATVAAPASGTVTFAGTVPISGRTVTVQTADGYSVTLTHLGSTSARRGLTIGEGAPVGTIGPSGEVEHDVPYVHLGIRRSEDPNGYVDPLRFLPVQPVEPAAPSPAATSAAAPAPPPPAAARAASAPPAPAASAPTGPPMAGSSHAAGVAAAPVSSTETNEPNTASARDSRRQVGSPLGAAGATDVTVARGALSSPVRGSSSERRVRESATRAGSPEKTVERRGPQGKQSSRTSPAWRPGVAPHGGHVASTASAPTPASERQRRSVPAWFWWAVLVPVAGAIAVGVRRRRRDSGSREPAPIIAANVALLPDNADLLRELEPTYRARVHDDRRRHPRAASPPARRRDLLPDRDGRERFEERARGRGSGGRSEDFRRPARRRGLAAPSRPSGRQSRLLHSYNR